MCDAMPTDCPEHLPGATVGFWSALLTLISKGDVPCSEN
jgi:hypothetical protein